MATKLVVYRVSDSIIFNVIDVHDGQPYVWDNSGSYVADGFVTVDGVKRVDGLDTDNFAVHDFTGSVPSDLLEKLRGDYTDSNPSNWIQPNVGYYKFNGDKSEIIVA